MSDDEVLNAAAHWHVRMAGDSADWDAFHEWLAADPRHRPAFDDIALLDLTIDRHRDRLRAIFAAPDA